MNVAANVSEHENEIHKNMNGKQSVLAVNQPKWIIFLRCHLRGCNVVEGKQATVK